MNINQTTGNNMSRLLNKVERRLGLKVLNLPDELGKDEWVNIIKEESLVTFSRYFPFKRTIVVHYNDIKDGFFFIDKYLESDAVILGVKDIDFEAYRADTRYNDRINLFSSYDFSIRDTAIGDMAMAQANADLTSLFNLGIYVEFMPPNKIKLVSVNGATVSRYRDFPLAVFTVHPDNLMTISPTMMEVFERLVLSDVATTLYNSLKYFDQLDTVFGTLDLKLDLLQDYMNKREDIIRELEEAHVSTANEGQLIIMTV